MAFHESQEKEPCSLLSQRTESSNISGVFPDAAFPLWPPLWLQELGNTIEEVVVGAGPCGELRYPVRDHARQKPLAKTCTGGGRHN
jgi:hypothetical protein